MTEGQMTPNYEEAIAEVELQMLEALQRFETADAAEESMVVNEPAEAIWLLRFNRDRKEFHEALQGPEVEACRRELEASGKSWRLPSGAYIFVHAHQYQHVMANLNERVLYSSNVVVSAAWLPLLEEIVTAGVRHREILAVPPATVPTTEASSAVSLPERRDVAELEGDESDTVPSARREKMYHLLLTHAPAGLNSHLLRHGLLQACKDELDNAGCQAMLSTGGAVFTAPEHYLAAIRAAEAVVPNHTLRNRDIVVTEPFFTAVKAQISTARKGKCLSGQSGQVKILGIRSIHCLKRWRKFFDQRERPKMTEEKALQRAVSLPETTYRMDAELQRLAAQGAADVEEFDNLLRDSWPDDAFQKNQLIKKVSELIVDAFGGAKPPSRLTFSRRGIWMDDLISLSKKMEEVFRPARQRRFGQPMTEKTLVELCRVARDTWRTVFLTKAFHAFKNALDQARKSAYIWVGLYLLSHTRGPHMGGPQMGRWGSDSTNYI